MIYCIERMHIEYSSYTYRRIIGKLLQNWEENEEKIKKEKMLKKENSMWRSVSFENFRCDSTLWIHRFESVKLSIA